jgi:hypothetical protein
MILTLSLLVSIYVAWWIVKPHFAQELSFSASGGDWNEMSVLLDQKSRVVQMLRDLELDYSTSKINDQDYALSKNKLSIELLEILKRLENANK